MIIRYVLVLLIGIIVGFLLCKASEILAAYQAPFIDEMAKQYPVVIGNLDVEDAWVRETEVTFIPIQHAKSKRALAVLLIKSPTDISFKNNNKIILNLTGFGSPRDIKPVIFIPSDLQKFNAGSFSFVQILDFGPKESWADMHKLCLQSQINK